MTLDEIKHADKTMLTPADVAGVLGCGPQKLRTTARQRPELLGFPVCIVGSRTKIPRLPFIQFLEGKHD